MLFLQTIMSVLTLTKLALEIMKLHRELKTADFAQSTVCDDKEVILVIVIIKD
jgi:hypothetical protein